MGSVTTFTQKYPSFNVMYLDPDTLIPVEYETYSFDLDAANKIALIDNGKTPPKWELKYKYTETFGMKDLSPESFLKFANNMLIDDHSARLYRNHRYIDHICGTT